MNARRRNAVELGFETIKKRRGSTTMSSVMSEFRVKEFPRVKAGLVTEEVILIPNLKNCSSHADLSLFEALNCATVAQILLLFCTAFRCD